MAIKDFTDVETSPIHVDTSAPSSPSTNDLWVDTNEFGVNITVGTTAPGSPATGDMWVDTN